MTAKPVGTVQQHCSPISHNPDTPSDVCFKLKNNEDKMGQELEELTTSSAGTGLKTLGQQGPPNEGTLEQRQTTASGFLTAGVNSSQGGRTPSPLERSTSTRTFADIFSTAAIQENRRHKTTSQQNKQFDPGGRGEMAPPWNAAVPLPLFSWGEAGRLLVCLSVAKLGSFLSVFSIFSALCVCSVFFSVFPNY